VANYHRLLRAPAAPRHPHVHGGRPAPAVVGAPDLATVARADVVWPKRQHRARSNRPRHPGRLPARARPRHLMSSWVTDSPGVFDPRPRSLRFRFVTAMAGVLGIGADLSGWSAATRTGGGGAGRPGTSRFRPVIHRRPRCTGWPAPDRPTAALQYGPRCHDRRARLEHRPPDRCAPRSPGPLVPGSTSTAPGRRPPPTGTGRRPTPAPHLMHARACRSTGLPEFDADAITLHRVA